MKTAMQLMIERIEFVFQQELKDEMQWWDNLKKGAIEAEKEQIMEANRKGVDMVINKENFITGEEYYNQTYNQKQHIIDIMKADEEDGLYNQNQ